jgi:hypothetical protein
MIWALVAGLIVGSTIYMGTWAGNELVREHHQIRLLKAEIQRLLEACR